MDLQKSKLAADTIRGLCMDAVQQANSGHPGMPMGCADFAYVLFQKYLKHNPADSKWIGRDRFILSAGHGSSLIYSLLHLYGYKVSLDDIKNFRQFGSPTAGHPEYGHIDGVDITTGPLGSGFASGVGMAMENKSFAARTGFDKTDLFDNKIFMIAGDGCMMEGSSCEAASLAGMQKLDNLICFYDDNSITIEGGTEIAFTENVKMRFESYDWRVIEVDDANDIAKCDAALAQAVDSDGRPTLIIGKTKIGFGSPNKAGSHECHGAPLGEDEIIATKKGFGISEEKFFVPAEVTNAMAERKNELVAEAADWTAKYEKSLECDSIKACLANKLLNKSIPDNLLEELLKVAPVDKAIASRVSSGAVLQKAAELVPSLVGGAADLAPSTNTNVKAATSFSPSNRAGTNYHFGVRELGMGLAANGMSLYGTAIPYTSTFFVFSDYMKPAMRLAALMKLKEIYVFTHDSFFVGEDGPTHQPIEQLLMMRSIPDFTVIRPADANEVAHAWNTALRHDGPVALVMTRQNLEPLPAELAKNIDVAKGAYVLSDDADADMMLIATGSEVNLALDSAKVLRAKGQKVRVVSMPSVELFEKQSCEYKKSVLPKEITKRVTLEAGRTIGWHKYAGNEGLCIGLDHFGASGPPAVLVKEFGFNPEAVVAKINAHFA